MIFFTVGLPGRFVEWCDAVIVALAASTGGSVSLEAWPTPAEMFGFQALGAALDQLALKLIADSPDHLVMGIRQPSERLRIALVDTKAPFIVALDDPRTAAAEVHVDTETDPITVTRAVANSCAALLRFIATPEGLAIHAEQARQNPIGTVCAIAERCGITISDERAARIVANIADDDPALALNSPGDWSVDLPAPTHRAVDGALGAYARLFVGAGQLGQIVWTRELFMLGNQRPPTEIIDVPTNAGLIIYGPYLHLPAGSWTARVTLGFSAEAARHNFMVDAVYAGRQIAVTTFQPGSAGIFTTDLFFSLDEPIGAGVEFRVAVNDNNAGGQMAFGLVALHPLSMRHTEGLGRSADFASVLEL